MQGDFIHVACRINILRMRVILYCLRSVAEHNMEKYLID